MPRSDPMTGQRRGFWGIAAAVVVTDAITKLMAVDALSPMYLPHRIVGDTLRLTLVYNPGAAFGLHLGPWSRGIFTVLTLLALLVLAQLHRATREGEWMRMAALALVSGGAVGNLIDRLRSARGVVDFIDVGIGSARWPTFNVADIAVTCGALLLALVLWREDSAQAAVSAPTSASVLDALPEAVRGSEPTLHR